MRNLCMDAGDQDIGIKDTEKIGPRSTGEVRSSYLLLYYESVRNSYEIIKGEGICTKRNSKNVFWNFTIERKAKFVSILQMTQKKYRKKLEVANNQV